MAQTQLESLRRLDGCGEVRIMRILQGQVRIGKVADEEPLCSPVFNPRKPLA